MNLKILKENESKVPFGRLEVGDVFLFEAVPRPYIKIGAHSTKDNAFRFSPASKFTVKKDTPVIRVDSPELRIYRR